MGTARIEPSTMARAVSMAVLTLGVNAGVAAQTPATSDPAAAPPVPATRAPVQGGLQEVVITAERRSTTAQKTPLSLTVLTGDDLENKGISSAKDLINATPGLAITSTTPNSNLSLRGVGSGGGNSYADPTVAFNLGGVNIARQFTTQASFYDLERVELLMGPQGTLYGRNATVGALNVIPNRPGFKFEGAFGLELGNYHNVTTTGMLNLPLNDDTAAMRMAFKTTRRDGYLSNGYNDADNQAGRLSLLLKPRSDLSLLLSADYFHDGAKGPSTVFMYETAGGSRWANSAYPWQGYLPAGCGNVALCPTFGNTSLAPSTVQPSVAAMSVVGDDGYTDNRQLVLKGELEWKLPGVTLTLLPASVRSDIHFKAYGQGFQQVVDNEVGQASVEARLASTGSGPLRWLAGAYWFSESQDSTGKFLEASGYQVIRNPNLDDTSKAVFGQATYTLGQGLRASLGLRYTRERKSQDGYTILDGFTCTQDALNGGAMVVAPNAEQPIGGCSVPNAGKLDFSSTNYKAGIEYDLGARSLLYANVGTAFKAGGFWPGTAPNTYKPELMTAYTFGSKNRFLDNRLQANFELFYWKYKDQQINVFTGINPAGQTARPFNTDGFIRGLQTNLLYRPSSNDQFSLDLLLSQGRYKAFPLGTNVLRQVVNNYAPDMPRLNMPTTSATIGYEHRWDVGDARVMLAARSHYESKRTLSALAVTGTTGAVLTLPGAVQPAYHVSNLTLTYVEPDGRWRISAFVDNIEDRAVVYTGTAGTISRGILYRPGNTNALYAALNAPRTFGLRMNASF
jgi:iron complex outermembrane receptor protein